MKPQDGSYPGGASSQFGMGMQVTPPVPPTTLGGLLPAPDVHPSGKPKMPREIQGGPGTPGYEQSVADFAAANPDLVQLADPKQPNPQPRTNAAGAVEHPGTAQAREVQAGARNKADVAALSSVLALTCMTQPLTTVPGRSHIVTRALIGAGGSALGIVCAVSCARTARVRVSGVRPEHDHAS